MEFFAGSLASDSVMKLVSIDDISKAPMFDDPMAQLGGGILGDVGAFFKNSFDATKMFVNARVAYLKDRLGDAKKRVWGGEDDDAAVDEFMKKFTQLTPQDDDYSDSDSMTDSEDDLDEDSDDTEDSDEYDSDADLEAETRREGGGWKPSTQYQSYRANPAEQARTAPDDGATSFLYTSAM